MSNVFLSGTIPNYKLMDQVRAKLKERYHSVGATSWNNPEWKVGDIIHSDIAIFILVKRGWYPFINWGDRRNVLVELGIAVGSGVQTVVVGYAEGYVRGIPVRDHPWVRNCDFQDLLNLIASNDLTYIPPTRVNEQEEKERRDREANL